MVRRSRIDRPLQWGIIALPFSIGIYSGERLYAVVIPPETWDWPLFGVVVNLLTLTWLTAALGALLVYGVNWWWTRRRGAGA